MSGGYAIFQEVLLMAREECSGKLTIKEVRFSHEGYYHVVAFDHIAGTTPWH
jgi:hypothetical protein